MDFDWTTFALEIVNFLVLIWILQRFLYRPVMNAIAERKARVEKTLADAGEAQSAAQSLKQQYENRMADWDREKTRARTQLVGELEVERARMMAALNVALEQEREKVRTLEQRRTVELRRKLEEEAVAEGGRFVARLLSRLASPQLEDKISTVVLEELQHLEDKDLEHLRQACSTEDAGIGVSSAYPFGDDQRSSLVQALSALAGQPVACDFRCDPELMAGLRINIGPWMLCFNLKDELKFFVEAHHAG